MTKFRVVCTFTVFLFVLSACTDDRSASPATATQIVPTLVTNLTTSTEMILSTPVPTLSPTVRAVGLTPLATNTPLPLLTVTSIVPTTTPSAIVPTAVAAETAVPPSIPQFEILQIEDIKPGKRITFQWTAVNADEVCLVSGTSRRLNPWWGDLPSEGTLTVEIAGTIYRNPHFTLQAYVGEDICYVPDAPADSESHVAATVAIDWACELDYFFTPAPQRCPLAPAVTSTAAEQPFEHGRLIWLEAENVVFVFYDDGRFQRYENIWQPGQLESDPSLIPPNGLYQPVRGFGQVWREQPNVREQLGWALAPEQGYTTSYQAEHHEGSSSGAPVYLRTIGEEIVWYLGVHSGNWGIVAP